MAQKSTSKKAPRWEKAFLAALRDTANVRLACDAAKVNRALVYRRRTSDEAFASAWDTALDEAADLLEAEALRRARGGVDEPVVYQGQIQGLWVNPETGDVVTEGTEGAVLVPTTVKRYSDTLLIFLLKAARPEKFRERHDVTVTKQGSEVDQEILNLTREMNQRDPARTS